MCGISCIVALETCTYKPKEQHLSQGVQGIQLNNDVERTAIAAELDASLELIKHRGPDSRGQWISPDKRVGTLTGVLVKILMRTNH